MSECHLISEHLIPLSASGVASKPWCLCNVCWAHFEHNSDNLRVVIQTCNFAK